MTIKQFQILSQFVNNLEIYPIMQISKLRNLQQSLQHVTVSHLAGKLSLQSKADQNLGHVTYVTAPFFHPLLWQKKWWMKHYNFWTEGGGQWEAAPWSRGGRPRGGGEEDREKGDSARVCGRHDYRTTWREC